MKKTEEKGGFPPPPFATVATPVSGAPVHPGVAPPPAGPAHAPPASPASPPVNQPPDAPPGLKRRASGPGLEIDFDAPLALPPYIPPMGHGAADAHFGALRRLTQNHGSELAGTVLSAHAELCAARTHVAIDELDAGRPAQAQAIMQDLYWRWADLAHDASNGRRIVTPWEEK